MLTWILGVFCALLVFLTLLPLSKRTVWWVRGADFPRAQLVVIGVAVLATNLTTWERDRTAAWIITAVSLLCIGYQLWWIWPYTRLYAKEVKTGKPDSPNDRLRIMSANILMPNRRVAELLRIVRAERPDVLVTLETNTWWERELERLEVDYPHTLKCPLENLYGMHLYSRFPLEDPKIQFLVEEDIPSMHFLLVLPSGRRVEVHCVHPAPPSPTENPTSKERDAELVMVGRSVVGSEFPVVVCGDLNDVAWSATTRLFRKVSSLLDPRIGRGMFNTYHAGFFFMRWPVDHVFHSKHFSITDLKRLPRCGSDHFPMLVELALDARASQEQEGMKPDSEDVTEAKEKMEKKGVSSQEVHQPGRSGRVRSDNP